MLKDVKTRAYTFGVNVVQDGLIIGYLTVALRSLMRDKVNLALTVFGLSIGLAASILIILFAIHEKSYDQFQPDAGMTYRMVLHVNQTENEYGLTTPRAFDSIKKINGVVDVFYLMKSWSDDKIK